MPKADVVNDSDIMGGAVVVVSISVVLGETVVSGSGIVMLKLRMSSP